MMAKRKYPKLPNGYGSIKRLSGNRTNCFGVYPPATEFTENGSPVATKALTYVNDWIKGLGVLTAYHNGTYAPGKELPDYLDCTRQNDLIQNIIAEYNAEKRKKMALPAKKTFKEVYKGFFDWKFNRDKAKNYSQSTKNSSNAAYKNFSALHNKEFESICYDDLQSAVDNCGLKHASMELMVSLAHQMYAYAKIYKIVKYDESQYLKINIEDNDEHGVPFTDDDLKILWANKADEAVEFILIMCYSGYRIAAYKNMDVNLNENYFKGGVKTASSKNRSVPIHSAIQPLVRTRMERSARLLSVRPEKYRVDMYDALERLGIEKHTPHDCRHTFSKLCEKYKVNENDRKRMLGHSFQDDITNSIYGHRSLEDLRIEIEKIKICH